MLKDTPWVEKLYPAAHTVIKWAFQAHRNSSATCD
eukprot:SAG31_NODE_19190_length_609_cov_3.023529_1_plen_34_part_01